MRCLDMDPEGPESWTVWRCGVMLQEDAPPYCILLVLRLNRMSPPGERWWVEWWDYNFLLLWDWNTTRCMLAHASMFDTRTMCLTPGCVFGPRMCVWPQAVCLTPGCVFDTKLCIWHQAMCVLTLGCVYDSRLCVWPQAVCMTPGCVFDPKLCVWPQAVCLTPGCVFLYSTCFMCFNSPDRVHQHFMPLSRKNESEMQQLILSKCTMSVFVYTWF